MKKNLIWIGVLFGLIACGRSSEVLVGDLRVEYLENPKGLEIETPRFSWKLSGSERGISQSGYHVVVATGESDDDIIWNSSRVESDETLNIVYAGPDLESGQKYYWKVRIWDQLGEASGWSDWAGFHMGLFGPDSKKAKWITIPDSGVSSPLLRAEFEVDQNIESATAYASAIGYYEFYLNDQKVGDHLIDPAMTDFRKRVLYETYDITDLIKNGNNAVGLWLGNGGFRVGRTDGRWSWYGSHYSYGTPRGWLQIEISLTDGSTQTFFTDENWKASASPIVYNDVYGGEDYDARLEQEGWSEPGFEDSGWSLAMVADHSAIKMEPQLMPAVTVTERFQPTVTLHPDSSTYLFDFGQNFAGVWYIEVEGEAGSQLKIRGAETLNDSLFPAPLKHGDRLSMNKVYHRDVWSTYTLKGGMKETFHPRFFYSGFRYLEVSVEQGQIHNLRSEGWAIHNDLPRNGHFESSDSLLNKIYRAAVWSQRGNLHGYPTDCPHREKGGYNGDGQVIAETSIHDFHMHPFYFKWLNDMRDSQEDNGRIPNTSPAVIGGIGGGIAWGSAYILLPMWMYEYYGDVRILEDHYPFMKKYMAYLGDLASHDEEPLEQFIINEFGGHWDSLGEWEAPVRERNGPVNPLTNTYYWYLNTLTMSRIARVLEKEEDIRVYESLAESIKSAINDKFYLKDLHLYGTEEPYQGYLLFALNGNIVPEEDREKVLQNLIDDIMVKSRGHLGTGILGTKHLFPVLAGAGREDVLHAMVTKTTFPSWGYWIANGATTLWENWAGQNSHNHQMFGTVNEYFYKYLAGIRPPGEGMTSVGYRQVHIQPYIAEGLKYVKASVESVRGRIGSEWEKVDGGTQFTVEIPPNTSGFFTIPLEAGQVRKIEEGGKTLWEDGTLVDHNISGVQASASDGSIRISLNSGIYRFFVTGTESRMGRMGL